jgi:hypothetical protein
LAVFAVNVYRVPHPPAGDDIEPLAPHADEIDDGEMDGDVVLLGRSRQDTLAFLEEPSPIQILLALFASLLLLASFALFTRFV